MQNQDVVNQEQQEEHFEMLLTQYFYQKVNQFLPQGYSLQPAKKKNNRKKDNTSNILKKKNEKFKQDQQKNKNIPQENIDFSKFEKIILLLKLHPNAKPFLNPVNPKKEGIPQYTEVIKSPMDLSTVHQNLKNKRYKNKQQIIQDLNKIWNNALIFNPQGSQIYNMAIEMQTKQSSLLFMSKKEIMKLCEGIEFQQSFEDQKINDKKQIKNEKNSEVLQDLENVNKMRNYWPNENKIQEQQNKIQEKQQEQNNKQNTKRLNKESSVSKTSSMMSLNSNNNQFYSSIKLQNKSIMNTLDFYSSTVGLK